MLFAWRVVPFRQRKPHSSPGFDPENGMRKQGKRSGLSSHDMDSWWIVRSLDRKPGLESKQISAKPLPSRFTPRGKVSKPSPLRNFPMPFYLSGWPQLAPAPGLTVTETALCSGEGEIKSFSPRDNSEGSETTERRLKILSYFPSARSE